MAIVTWDPSLQQQADPDTIWMLDTSVETSLSIDDGGLIDAAGTFTSEAACDPWRSGSGYAIEAGRFTDGIRGNAATGAWLFMPGEHLPTGSFTIEMWVKADLAWSSYGQTFLLSFGTNRPDSSGPSVAIYSPANGKLAAHYRHYHNGATEVNQTIIDSVVGPADEWVGVFLTYDGTTLTLRKHASGTLTTVGTKTVTPAASWGADDDRKGMSLLGGRQSAGGGQCDGWLVSDVRVSRVCRVPGVAVDVPAANTVTIGSANGDTIPELLNGVVHYFAKNSAQVGNDTIDALTSSMFSVGRTDKILSCLPIKSGDPDSTRPTLGHSGSYSYDFRPLEHTLDYYVQRNMALYVGLDSTPSILGGSVSPMSSADCADATKLTGHTAFARQVPNDMAAMATICADVYWHITRTLGLDPVAWGVWNEPSGGSFWAGNTTQFNQMYEAIANAITAIDADAYIGAPDDGVFTSYVSSLITYCGANNVPLRFVSVHTYGGEMGYAQMSNNRLASLSSTAGITKPDLIVGEWGWNIGNIPGTGRYPFKTRIWPWISAWNASHALSFLAQSRHHTSIATRFSGVPTETSDTGENAMGPVSTTNRWAPGNAFDVWGRIAGQDELEVTDDLENGVRVVATTDNDGTTRVLAVNHKWRLDRTTDLTITLPASVASGAVTEYRRIDSETSSYYDTQTGSGELEIVNPPSVDGGTVTLTMEPRSVHLLTISPETEEVSAVYGIAFVNGRPTFVQVRPN